MTTTPDWWNKWRQEAGQYGRLRSDQPAAPSSPVLPPQAQGAPQTQSRGDLSFLSRFSGRPFDYSQLPGAARYFMPFIDTFLTGISRSGGLLGGSSQQSNTDTPDWWKRWRDERGGRGLL